MRKCNDLLHRIHTRNLALASHIGATRKVQNRHLDERTLGQVDAGAPEIKLANSLRLFGDKYIRYHTLAISMAVR